MIQVPMDVYEMPHLYAHILRHTHSSYIYASALKMMQLIVDCSTNMWTECGPVNHCIPVILSCYEYYAAVVKWYSPQRGNGIVHNQSSLAWLLYTGQADSDLHTLPFLLAGHGHLLNSRGW